MQVAGFLAGTPSVHWLVDRFLPVEIVHQGPELSDFPSGATELRRVGGLGFGRDDLVAGAIG